MDNVNIASHMKLEGDVITVKKCLNRATSKEGSIFYIGMGRGVNGNSRKFGLNVIFDSGTIPQVFVISEACHSSL